MKIGTAGWADVAASHGQTVFGAAREFAGDDDSAWDCVQEAFVTALSRGVAEVEEPVSWLCGVARNHARNLRRSRRRWWSCLSRLSSRRVEVAATPASAEEDGLGRALADLPAAQREAVVLRYLGEMSLAEVAAAQRVSEDAAKARVHRGLRRLRRTLGTMAVLVLLVRTAAAGVARKEALLAAARSSAATALTVATAAQFLLPFLLVTAAYVTFRTTPENSLPLPAANSVVASLTPGFAPAQVAPPAVPNGKHRIVFRDLQDGSPLPGFQLKLGTRVVTADRDGAIVISPLMASVAPVTAGWVLAGRPEQTLIEGGELWFARKIKVRGRVTVPADSKLPLTEVKIGWRYRDGSRGWRGTWKGKPWADGWSAMHMLDRSRRPVRAAPDGTFEIDALAVRNLYVWAYVSRWMPGVADVPFTEEGDPEEVSLAIRDRAIRLHGTVRAPDGTPLRGLYVRAIVTQRMSGDDYARSYTPIMGHALTSTVGKAGAVVCHHADGVTGPRGNLGPGQFEIFLGVPGEILIVAYPQGGFAPIYHRITRGVGDDGRVRLKVDRVGEDARVTLTSGGVPIAPGYAKFHEFSLGGPQTTFRVPVGPGGRMSTALLTPGHRYRVDFRASLRPIRYLVWEPTRRLEIDNLPLEPPWWEKK